MLRIRVLFCFITRIIAMSSELEEKNMIYDKIYTSSGCVVFCKDKGTISFLALKQKRHTGDEQWVAPKGQIEKDESSQEAALRELQE